jgi:signal transduction histidine kinase
MNPTKEDPARGDHEGILLHAIIDHLPIGVALAHAATGVLYYHNREAQRILGHPTKPTTGISDYAIYGAIHEDGTPYVSGDYPLARALTQGIDIREERMRYRRADGDIIHLMVDARPLWADGRMVRGLCTFTDVTRQRAAEAERDRALDELNQFAAHAAHDLREPLRTVCCFAHLAGREEEADRRKGHLLRIEQASERANALVGNLLHYSMAGQPLTPVPVPAGEVVNRALALLAGAIRDSSARIEVEPLPAVLADAEQLVRVMQNLLANAIRYARSDRAPQVRISGRCADGQAFITLEDNGRGIPASELEAVFIPFRRGTEACDQKGTGLGLAICRRIVERCGGRLWLEAGADGTRACLALKPA